LRVANVHEIFCRDKLAYYFMVKTYVFILCLAFVADYVSGGALPQWWAHPTQSKSINKT
jgi:hypothetical protein